MPKTEWGRAKRFAAPPPRELKALKRALSKRNRRAARLAIRQGKEIPPPEKLNALDIF